MRYNTLETTIERSSDFEEMQMTIDKESVAHILHIIRSQLYSDKIGSPLREYACNAQDAHLEAGIAEKPIQIHIPTEDDPHLKIIDFGNALTKDEMDKIFRRFGKSTKRANENAIGCLGIGAKSCFAYTDSFTVISKTVRGTHARITKYAVYIDETRLGKIAVLSEEENPNKETGLTIEIPINEDDYGSFEQAAFAQTRFFTPQPLLFKNGTQLDRNDKLEVKEILPGVFGISGVVSYAVMGGVAYRINPDNVRVKIRKDVHGYASGLGIGRKSIVDMMLRQGLVFRVPLGEVEFDASRENLSYSTKTIRAIVARCLLANKKLVQIVSKDLDSQPTWADALQAARTLHSRFQFGEEDLKKATAGKLSWKGRSIPESISSHLSARQLTLERPIGVTPSKAGEEELEDFLELKLKVPDQFFGHKATVAQRLLIPVLHNFPPHHSSRVGHRVYGLQRDLSRDTVLVLYSPPRKINLEATQLPKGGLQTFFKEVLLKEYVHHVLHFAYGISRDELKNYPDTNSAISFFKSLGGILLSDLTPVIPPHEKSKQKVERLPKRELVDRVNIYKSGHRYVSCNMRDFTPTKQNIVYWPVSGISHLPRRATSHNHLILRTTTCIGSTHMRLLLQRIEEKYDVECLFISLDLNYLAKVECRLPQNWARGDLWLKDKWEALIPPEVRFFWQNSSQTPSYNIKSCLEALKEKNTPLPPELQTYLAHSNFAEASESVKFLLQPPLYTQWGSLRRAENDPIYEKAEKKCVLTSTLTQNSVNPFAKFPLLNSLTVSKQIDDYINLVLRAEQLEKTVTSLQGKLDEYEKTYIQIQKDAEETSQEEEFFSPEREVFDSDQKEAFSSSEQLPVSG